MRKQEQDMISLLEAVYRTDRAELSEIAQALAAEEAEAEKLRDQISTAAAGLSDPVDLRHAEAHRALLTKRLQDRLMQVAGLRAKQLASEDALRQSFGKLEAFRAAMRASP